MSDKTKNLEDRVEGLLKAVPPKDAEEKGLPIGYPAKPSGERTQMVPSKQAATKKPEKDEEHYNYPMMSDRLEDAPGADDKLAGKRQSGWYEKAVARVDAISKAGQWLPFTGPHGGVGAKNNMTGEEVYGARAQSLLHAQQGDVAPVDGGAQGQPTMEGAPGMPGAGAQTPQQLDQSVGMAPGVAGMGPMGAPMGQEIDPAIPHHPEAQGDDQGAMGGSGGPGPEGDAPLTGDDPMGGNEDDLYQTEPVLQGAQHPEGCQCPECRAMQAQQQFAAGGVMKELRKGPLGDLLPKLQQLDNALDTVLQTFGAPGETGPEQMQPGMGAPPMEGSPMPLDHGADMSHDMTPPMDDSFGMTPHGGEEPDMGAPVDADGPAMGDMPEDDSSTDMGDETPDFSTDSEDAEDTDDAPFETDDESDMDEGEESDGEEDSEMEPEGEDVPASDDEDSPAEAEQDNEEALEDVVPEDEHMEKQVDPCGCVDGVNPATSAKCTCKKKQFEDLRDRPLEERLAKLLASGTIPPEYRALIVKAVTGEVPASYKISQPQEVQRHSDKFSAVLKQLKDAGHDDAKAHRVCFAMIGKEYNPSCDTCFKVWRSYEEPHLYFDTITKAAKTDKLDTGILGFRDYKQLQKEWPHLKKLCKELI